MRHKITPESLCNGRAVVNLDNVFKGRGALRLTDSGIKVDNIELRYNEQEATAGTMVCSRCSAELAPEMIEVTCDGCGRNLALVDGDDEPLIYAIKDTSICYCSECLTDPDKTNIIDEVRNYEKVPVIDLVSKPIQF